MDEKQRLGVIEEYRIDSTEHLANAFINKLNKMRLSDESAIDWLVDARAPTTAASFSEDVLIHKDHGCYYIGLLEVLNSLLGPIPDGPKAGEPYIMALYKDAMIYAFVRNDAQGGIKI